ncbi:hypothetical protein EDB89DRAFT_2081957 [Lactarius sanguifluus]|nr:hypothetical protein EDB89DRAFT_2081957 [Lactarius sanguifluus]
MCNAATAQSVRGLVTLKSQHGRVLHLIPNGYDIKLEGEELGKQIDSKAEKDRPIPCPVYYDGESVSGQVTIRVREGSVQRTTGSNSTKSAITELFYDRCHHRESFSLSQEVAALGDLR